MFEPLLQNPLVLAFPPILSIVFSFLLSRLIELIPGFAIWWDKLTEQTKYAYRGWAGLILSVVLVMFAYFAKLLTLDLSTPAAWLVLIASILISWLTFVGGAQSTYQVTKSSLPRKQAEWTG